MYSCWSQNFPSENDQDIDFVFEFIHFHSRESYSLSIMQNTSVVVGYKNAGSLGNGSSATENVEWCHQRMKPTGGDTKDQDWGPGPSRFRASWTWGFPTPTVIFRWFEEGCVIWARLKKRDPKTYVYTYFMVKMRINLGSFGLFWFNLGWG